ncbi:MAG: RnfABCDGE type electron transport complex subunit B [Spirochaetales bacterium]|jgi:electron transport complex protein RnfB|nr:RnfABCDGE type electron transport complex subunit B [Spirochaetales bacterium]
MILNILYAFLTVTILGAILGIGLAYASKKLAVKKDDRIAAVETVLPGANCGACGYAGCAAYAEAVALKDADMTLCGPGGASVVKLIADIMGKQADAGSDRKMVARVHCFGNHETTSDDYAYEGLEDCNAVHMMFQGDKSCKYGCLALGSCIKVCPADAIIKRNDGRIHVDRDRCISCEKCVTVCPTGVMKMIPYDAEYYIACNSNDKGGTVKKTCSVGCIGCKICEKKFPDAAFTITNFLAYIDYDKEAKDQDKAAQACPVSCIRLID